MNKGLNIFLVVLLCVVVYIGLLLSFYSSKNVEASNPYLGDVKSTRGTYGTYAVSVGANSMGSDMAAISVRSANSIFHHRPVFSYAPAASMPTYSQSPIGGTLSKSVASPIYTTSSAEFHSFGGGGNGGGASMSGGAVSAASPSASATGLTTTMPSTSVFAYNTKRNNSTAASDVMSSVPGDIAMASTQAYAGIGNTTGGTSRGISGRKNGAVEDSWLDWLYRYGNKWGSESGDDQNGYTYSFSYNNLLNAYNDYVTNYWQKMWGDPPTFAEWLTWFQGNNGGSHDYKGNTYSWVPVGDYYPLLILAMLYVGYVAIRRRKSKISENNI